MNKLNDCFINCAIHKIFYLRKAKAYWFVINAINHLTEESWKCWTFIYYLEKINILAIESEI